LTQAIADLRRAFEDDVRSPRIIQTVAKRGYRLIPSITRDAPPHRLTPAPTAGQGAPAPAAHRADGAGSSRVGVLTGGLLALFIGVALASAWSAHWLAASNRDEGAISSPSELNGSRARALARDEVRWGIAQFSRWTPEGWLRARGLFERAARRDPASATANAWAGVTYCLLGFFDLLPRDEAYRRGRAAVDRSLLLQPDSADSLFGSAALQFVFEGNWQAAEAAYRRSLALSPDAPWTHWGLAWLLTAEARHPEAIAEMQSAIQLDPVNPYLRTSLGEMYWYAGRREAARDQFMRMAALDPSFTRVYDLLILFYETQREYAAAIHERHLRARVRGEAPDKSEQFARAYRARGEAGYWEMRLQEALANDDIRELPYVYAFLGRTDQAVALLQRQFRPLARTAPQFAPLRGDSRFKALLQRWKVTK
jgi:tetratricopeptide (TPR) repeat protein